MIRQLLKSDQAALKKWASYFSPRPEFNWEPQVLVETLDDSPIWGYFEQHDLAAAVAYQVQPDFHEIIWLATLPQYAQRGFMKSLLQNRMDDALSQGRSVLLEVHENNSAALRLYSQLGFARVGVRKNYYKDGAAAILMTYPAPQKGS